MKTATRSLAFAVLALFAQLLAAVANSPNIVIILADDLGYADVGFHGSDIRTPNIDRIADEGLRLEQFYVAPMCSPTRAGLMTGRYPVRFGMMRAVVPPWRDKGLDPAEWTLPEMLAKAGYNYRGAFGKWHLGHRRPEWHPLAQGFTHFVGCYNGAIDYFTHERSGERDWHRNREPYEVDGYATDLITDETVAFIESVPEEEPYFVYVPYTAPHSPFQAKEEDIAKYPHREGREQMIAAMIDSMDQGIGRILAAIEARPDASNTLILFSSDNGGIGNGADNTPMRGSKLTVFQGGIRVVAVCRWPDGGLTGGGVVNARIGYIDVMPTLAALVGGQEDPERPFDGIDVMSTLKGEGILPDRPWFTYLDQSDTRVQRFALNYDSWKYILERPAPDAESDEMETRQFLFRIDQNPSERGNLIEGFPELQQRLANEVAAFAELIQPDQVQRYHEGRDDLVVPPQWKVR